MTQTQMLPRRTLDGTARQRPDADRAAGRQRSLASSRIVCHGDEGQPSVVGVDLRSNGFDTDGLERLVLALRTCPT